MRKISEVQIFTFSGAISTGSLLAAISFFSNRKDSDVNRPKLMQALAYLVYGDKNGSSGVLVGKKSTNTPEEPNILTYLNNSEKMKNI